MRDALIIYAAALAQLAVFVTLTVALARAVGAHVTKIQLGSSPSVVLRRAEPEVRWGPIPSGSVDLLGRGADEQTEDSRAWTRLSLARRLLVIVAPWPTAFAIAAACLGPARAASSFAHGFVQLVWTLDLSPLVRATLDHANREPATWLGGIVIAKLIAFNLLPVGGLAGAGILRELATRDRKVPAAFGIWNVVTLLVVLWIAARLAWAFVQAIRG